MTRPTRSGARGAAGGTRKSVILAEHNDKTKRKRFSNSWRLSDESTGVPGWEQRVDPASGRTYYWNRDTGESSWVTPGNGAAGGMGQYDASEGEFALL